VAPVRLAGHGAAAPWARALDGGCHHRAKLLEVHRLGQVVEGARFQRVHRVLGRAVGGHDDAALGALLRLQLAQQLQAQAVGQPHVGDHARQSLAVRQQLARLGQRGGRIDR
jgi:hypothetical protein